MKPNNTIFSGDSSRSQDTESLVSTNFSQREMLRHKRLASITIPIFMLFLLTLLPQAVANTNLMPTIALAIELGVCLVAFFLNRKGLVRLSGILTLTTAYAGGTFTMLYYPGGLTESDLYLLGLTIIPNVLALAFFSAKSLLPIVCLNAIQVWAVLTHGPHDRAITNLLQTAPLQTFFNIYTLQLIIATALYFWASSTEQALARADQAEEIALFKRQEQEWQMQELEKKHRLDHGIQQILQTHVAVANGDLNARAPLLRDHELWQVAGALNNLIARLQSLSQAEHALRQHTQNENMRITGQYTHYEQPTGSHPKYEQPTGSHPRYEQTTGAHPKYEQPTGAHSRYELTTGSHSKYEQTTDQYPNYEQITGQHLKYKQFR